MSFKVIKSIDVGNILKLIQRTRNVNGERIVTYEVRGNYNALINDFSSIHFAEAYMEEYKFEVNKIKSVASLVLYEIIIKNKDNRSIFSFYRVHNKKTGKSKKFNNKSNAESYIEKP